MNERIHKLAEESGITQYVAADNKYLERFAELIVRECAVWMDNATVTDSAGNKDYIGDSFFWADELKKHFGVEE
jgi:hypothetical protein